MALSGTITGAVTQNAAAYNFYATWTATQSIAGNYSDITIKVYWSRNAGKYNEFDTVGERSAKITIGAAEYTWAQRYDLIPFEPNPYLLKEYTARVYHDADGTKSPTIAARANGYASTYGPSNNALAGGDCTLSESITLDTIPRASTAVLDKSTLTAGDNIKVTITPAVGTFTHSVTWACGAYSSTVALAAGVTIHTLTAPTAWCAAFPAANSGTLTCTVQTKSGSTNIGAPVSKTATMSVPSYTPTASLSLTGNALLGGEYVQGKSTATGAVTAGSSYGATISSISTTASGKTYTGAAFTTSALTAAGSITLTTTATDSRGKTKTAAQTITVRAYAAPYITALSAERCLSNGTPSDSGTYGKVTFKGGCSAVNDKNARSYKVNGGTIANTSYTIDKTDIIIAGITTETTHTVTATIQDSYSTVSASVTIPTVAVTMDYHSSGKGVAFGKISEAAELLDIAWPVKLHDTPAATGNMLALTGAGVIGDSGKAPADFAAAAQTQTIYQATAGWVEAASWDNVRDAVVRIRAYAGRGFYAGRGHWEVLFCVSSGDTARADLVTATNGITPAKFDLRLVGSTFSLYFDAARYSHWQIVAESFRAPVDITLYNQQATPTGTAIPVDWGEHGIGADAGKAVVTGASGVLEAVAALPITAGGTGETTAVNALAALGLRKAKFSITTTTSTGYYTDYSLTDITTGSVVIAASNRETNWSSTLVQLSHAVCRTNGSIRLYWTANVTTALTIPVSVIYSV